MNRKKMPWLPESSGEYIDNPVPFDVGDMQKESELRRRNERVFHPNDGFYQDETGYLRKVTNGPYVNGRQWERLQRRDYW